MKKAVLRIGRNKPVHRRQCRRQITLAIGGDRGGILPVIGIGAGSAILVQHPLRGLCPGKDLGDKPVIEAVDLFGCRARRIWRAADMVLKRLQTVNRAGVGGIIDRLAVFRQGTLAG